MYDPREVWARAKKRLDTMSDEERVQTLVDAGILNEDLSVAEPYVEVFKKRDEAVEPESAASPS